MSSLADWKVIEPNTKRGKLENEDRLTDLPEFVLLHVLSFLNAKHTVRTCILSKRWKHLWKRIPALILHFSRLEFPTFKSFDKFASTIMSLRDGSTPLHTLHFRRVGSCPPHILRKIANYIRLHSSHLNRLVLCVTGNSSLILPCVSSCRALTSLKLSIYPRGDYPCDKILFPKSLNLPSLTSLDLTNFAFCTSGNTGRAEPFSTFNNLNTLILYYCAVEDAEIVSISSATLVSLTIDRCFSYFTKIELSSPSLSTFTCNGTQAHELCGSTLSSVKQANIDVSMYVGDPLVLLSWLLNLPNVRSLTVTSDTLRVLSKVPDLFKVNFPSLCNLKSLKIKMRAFEAGLEQSTTIPERIVGFLLQNSPSAKVDIIGCWQSRKPMQNDTSLNEDAVEKSQPNTQFPPLDNGPPRDIDMRWLYFAQQVEDVSRGANTVTVPGECHESYLPWYYQVSTPNLTTSLVDVAHQVPAQNIPAPASVTAEERLDIAAARIREAIGSTGIEPNSPAYRLIWSALYVLQGGGP